MTAPSTPPVAASGKLTRLPFVIELRMLLRTFAIQGAWNYETALGNGIGFCMEPALRLLPGGIHSPEFKAAMARESKYFNAHPYCASVAVGALARAELDMEPAEKIERFRTALGGPLGSVGDRLVWAGWLPFCSLVALMAFGLEASTFTVLAVFLGLYNVGHVALRAWGLRTGWSRGMHVAQSLGNPVLRHGNQVIVPLAAFAAGLGVPLTLLRIIGPGRALLGVVLATAVIGAFALVRLQGRIEGWRLALVAYAAAVLFAVIGR